METYPTGATLAQFRRAIRPDLDDIHPDASPDMAAYHGLCAAWSDERAQGIGFRIARLPSPAWREDPFASRATDARAMAGAMRSRAYRRQFLPVEFPAPGMLYAVQATRMVAIAGPCGIHGMTHTCAHAGAYAVRQVPTFYLAPAVQGIVSAEHAARIAADVIGPDAVPSSIAPTLVEAW